MPLVDGKSLLLETQRKHKAIPAFNVENMEFVQGVVSAAEKMEYPVIIQTTPSTVRYASVEYFAAIVKCAAEKSTARIALHLDHGDSLQLAADAMAAGYTSVMIDGSKLPFAENMELTKSVTKKAAGYGVSVEAELGTVGGKEDSASCSQILYTDAEEAAEFVEKTGVDSLAVAIGTAHGFYKGEPKLNLKRLEEIRNKVEEAVKANFSAEGVDPKKYLGAGRQAVEAAAVERIRICRLG